MGLLDGVVAVVTGAGHGIGRCEALELARGGARVVVNDVDPQAASAVVGEIASFGGSAAPEAGDVADPDCAEALVRRAIDEFGQLDALVNNAGILRDRTVVNMEPDEWDAVIRVHLRGHYAPTRAACSYWKGTQRPGRIVCTSSTSGLLGNFGQANYGAAKAGIAAFSAIVAQEMARYGVRCNAIAPAARTRMTESAYGEIPSIDAGFDFWSPENVAPFVAFLCSEAAGDISGKVFGVQGDVVELYQPWTSVAAISNDGQRWDVSGIAERVDDLFTASSISPQMEQMMAKLRYRMSSAGA